MLCRIDGCTTPQLSGRPFCCKKHWPKVPRKIKSELNKLYDSGDGSITVINFGILTTKANFALTIPDNWEKRAKFHFKKETEKRAKEKILIVTGKTNTLAPLWPEFFAIMWKLKLNTKLEIVKDFKEAVPHRVAIVMGMSGFKKTLPPYKVKHGIVHMGQEVVSPKAYIAEMWKHRPVTGSYTNNIYLRSCEAHPEEYESFEEDELNEITKCLEWAKALA